MSADRVGVPAGAEMALRMRAPTTQSSLAVPAAIANPGDHAARRFLDFFAATIRNKTDGVLPSRLSSFWLARGTRHCRA